MGASASKVARSTANTSARRYPARSSGLKDAASSQLPPTRAKQAPGSGVQASYGRTSAIDIDGRDPQLAASLQRIGPVQPNPTYSTSSISNQAATTSESRLAPSSTLQALQARQRIQEDVQLEKASAYGREHEGRKFLDIPMLHKIMALRDERDMSSQEIEQLMNLKRGLVDRLGARGLVRTA